LGFESEELRAMKDSRFTTEQIALRQAEAGLGVEETCRKLGISQATFFRWKAKYGDLGTAELRRLRQLEGEDQELKRLAADLSLDKRMLQDVLARRLRARRVGSASWRS
jgi:putative transposase